MEISNIMSAKRSDDNKEFLYFAGFRYLTFALLPALTGTTLPFWLCPPGFTFKWFPAIEFVIAVVFFHLGFSLLLAWRKNNPSTVWSRNRLLKQASVCLIVVCIIGLHLNKIMILHAGVPDFIFMVYGFAAFFVGGLYVLPPFNFYQRAGGEIIISEGMGMIPLLGAYLIQVGDLTRTVYLASLPMVIATGLWVWIDKLARNNCDRKNGYNSLVNEFGIRFSGRYGVAALSLGTIAVVSLTVYSGSINPIALIALLSIPILWKVVIVCWNEYLSVQHMINMRHFAFFVHLFIGLVLAVSSLSSVLK